MTLVDITIDGRRCQLRPRGARSLLDLMRDDLGKIGTKRGCNHGVCGACTVLIDGLPHRACLTIGATADEAEVTTVEGLERLPIGRALQQAFAETGAVQCGFCTAGMLIAAYALLAANPQPSVAEVQEALAGNICRCTGYRKIVVAVLLAASRLEEAP